MPKVDVVESTELLLVNEMETYAAGNLLRQQTIQCVLEVSRVNCNVGASGTTRAIPAGIYESSELQCAKVRSLSDTADYTPVCF